MYKKYIKRIIDFILAIIGSILLSPMLLFVSIVIKIDSSGPVIFKQKRVAKDGKFFNIYKFRTMKVDTPKDTATDQLDNPNVWITRSGKVLRKTSLDELPQLINIIKGDMSIVGPRPALWNQFNLIKLRNKKHINSIRPGLTGLAQINGRDENSYFDKVYWDSEYIKKYNFIFDFKCILKTIIYIIKRDGYSEGGKRYD